jgi:phosphatidylglycerol lysyltransferase
MNAKSLKGLGPLFSLMLFSAAVWILYHELKAYHFNDIVRNLEEFPAHRLMDGFLLTLLSYFLMTGYDVLALGYIRHPLAYSKIALASFIGYAFSNNIGFSMIAGASVRYRLYSAWGLSGLDISKVVVFCALTLWLGFFTLAGLIFLCDPMGIPNSLHLPFTSVRPIGMILLVVVAAYIFFTVKRKKPLVIRNWEILLPSVRLVVSQILLAGTDWLLAGTVLYALMPSLLHISYLGFLTIYLLAQLAGMISQVPGGLGVFETVMVLLLSGVAPTPEILGTLLAYRGLYYLLPLAVAAGLLGAQEILRKKGYAQRFVGFFGHWVSGLLPSIMGFATFVAGAILLFSGATPATHLRLVWLKKILPLPLLEVSHFLGSLAGMGLLMLGRGLQRRLDAAYVLVIVLLWLGILASLLKGLDYEEALFLSIVLLALLPCRKYFYRRASLFSQRFDPEWIVAIIIVLICSVWLGFFSYRHVEYSDNLWWQFTFGGNAPRFLRATVGAIGVALLFALARLLRPAPPKPRTPSEADLGKIVIIVRNSPDSAANLALLGDKVFLPNQIGNAFIMYAVQGRSWIAMGDPVGPQGEWSELIWQFREISDRFGGWTVFYEVGPHHLHFYLDLGLTLLKLGEEARVSLIDFSLEGGARKGLRYTQRKLEKEGCAFQVIASGEVAGLLPELKAISDAWMLEKNTREKGFSLGFFEPIYLKQFPMAVIHRNDKIIALANIWQGAEKAELTVDLMRYLPEAPDGVMDYLFTELMLWGRRRGYGWFNLGMAPLTGIEDRALAPLWNRLAAFVARYGEHFYNFQGLRKYKDKFDPVWVPRYLASPGGLALPRILTNLTALISRGIRGAVAK